MDARSSCNILFTRALARRLDPAVVTASACIPASIATAIGDRAGSSRGFGWRLVKLFLPGPEKGAATSIFLATTPDPAPFHGAYVIGKTVAEPEPRRSMTARRSAVGRKRPAGPGLIRYRAA